MFKKLKALSAFSLVELMISLITVSLITAAFAPVITKKLSHGAITLGTFGGGSAEGKTCSDSRYYFENNECVICPEGHHCDGTNKYLCLAGTYARQGQTQCAECPDGYYSANGASECLENTADNCAEKSKTENGCESCGAGTVKAVNGSCVDSVPLYSYKNASGDDVTETATEVTENGNYWYIKIKTSGTLSFQTLPTNSVDVFLVGSGAAGQRANNCSALVGGGGNIITEKNVHVMQDIAYPITIGASVSTANCSITVGKTTSGFGLYAYGGVNEASHSTCAFGDSSYCPVKYGETGSDSNQQANTGNGGNKAKASMTGVVIVRGLKNNPTHIIDGTIPSYKFIDSNGADVTTQNSVLTVDKDYWYLKLTKTGVLSFSTLPTNSVDVFLVGSGAAGQRANNCSSLAGGGGNTVTEENVQIATEIAYPITIASSVSTANCSITTGNTTSGFGLYAHGGIYQASHTTCPFGASSCEVSYGNVGSDSNQNSNTGNGGTKAKGSMNGVVIIRGKRQPMSSLSAVPIYTYFNTSGTDVTNSNSILSVNGSYWYLKLTASGKILFNYLPSEFIDVFLVGGGAGGKRDNNCHGSAPGGGGNVVSEKDVYVSLGTSYPVTIGSSTSYANCSITTGTTTGAFGMFAYGGINSSDQKKCPFNDISSSVCTTTYGNLGSDSNQNNNTGNGGARAKGSMDGVVILRGKTTSTETVSNNFPVYKFKNSSGVDIALKNSMLTKFGSYWYLKLTASGTLSFQKLASDKIDVFVVGGGAAGQKANNCSSLAGGGGAYNISKGISVETSKDYPIVIGAGVSSVNCRIQAGNPSSAFGVSASGGSGQTSNSVCLFNESNETNCLTTYGNVGSDSNQNNNTGNGGTKANGSMGGIVILRGLL